MELGLRDFERAIDQVVTTDDQVIVLFSGIWTFGARFNATPRELPSLLASALLDRCGPSRTLLVPTYTYGYTRTRHYDPDKSPPETGVLAEEFLSLANTRRSVSALNSYAVAGPAAEEVVALRGDSLWGRGSVMEWLEQHNARVCVLGLPWERACAYFHRIEEVAAVPYRYFKRFPGTWEEQGIERPWSETMYVRTLSLPGAFQWEIVVERLRRAGRILGDSNAFLLESALARDITAAGVALLRSDPYALLRNAEAVRAWVRDGKAAEIAELPSAERDVD